MSSEWHGHGHEPLTWEVRKQGWEEGGGRVWKKNTEREVKEIVILKGAVRDAI